MREKLIQYVELLFEGTQGMEDIRQEILQNTLDRYDDLIAEGKVPEAAYRLAIHSIGDIREIMDAAPQSAAEHPAPAGVDEPEDSTGKRRLRAIAVGLYILCPMPLFLLSELGLSTLGLCGTLAIVAAATVMLIMNAKKGDDPDTPGNPETVESPRSELHKSISSMISVLGLVAYFAVSFATHAWFITWVIFPLTGAVQGLVKAILDLKEAMNNEA